jgi:hypothetical protein
LKRRSEGNNCQFASKNKVAIIQIIMLTSDIGRSPLPLPDHKPYPPKAQDLKQFEVICRVRPLQESEATSGKPSHMQI